MVITVFLSLVVVETTLYAFGVGDTKTVKSGPYMSIYGWTTWDGSDHLSTHPHKMQTNQFGFRGHQYNQALKNNIVLLGDSQVETSHSLHQMPEVYLKKNIERLSGKKTNVISMGSWGWGTDQQYLALKENISLIKPKHVALWFTSNDWTDNILPEGFNGKKPTFHLLGESLKGPNYQFREHYKESNLLRIEHVLENRGIWRWWRDDKNASFYNRYVSRALKKTNLEKCNIVDNNIDLIKTYIKNTRREEWANKPKYNKEGVLVSSGYNPERTYNKLKERYLNKIGTKDSLFIKYRKSNHPLMSYGVALTRKLLLEIKSLSEKHGAKFTVFFVEPPDHAIQSENIKYCHNGRVYEYSVSAYRNLLLDTFKDLNFVIFDKMLPKDYRDNFDGHLNNKSNQIIMEQLARALLR